MLLLFLAILGVYAQNAPQGIQGVVKDESGKVVKDAIISYSRIPKYLPRQPGQTGRPVLAPGEVALSGSISADAIGAFQFANLPLGDYRVCAHHPAEPYLDPCKWGNPVVATTKPAVAATPSIVTKRGVFLRIHVNDPNQFLGKADFWRSDLTVGVMFGIGGFHSAMLASSITGRRDYQIAVPTGQALWCWIWSGDYTLSDDKGTAVPPAGAKLPFEAIAGVDEQFTFNVTGKKGAH